MNITITFDKKTPFVDTINNTPIIPLGIPIKLVCNVTNTSKTDITIEDPATSQNTMGYCKQDDSNEEISFMLNPSHMDVTGEITRPSSQMITLKPGENREFTVALYKYIMDKCFIPGPFSVSFAYENERSMPCSFIVQFTEESIDSLLPILNDQTKDEWVKQKAYTWLKKVNPEFECGFNKESIEDYRVWWDEHKGSDEIDKRIREINVVKE